MHTKRQDIPFSAKTPITYVGVDAGIDPPNIPTTVDSAVGMRTVRQKVLHFAQNGT